MKEEKIMKTKKLLGVLLIGFCLALCTASLAACCSMEKETGLVEGSYTAQTQFSKISLDINGGVDFEFSYGQTLSIDYTQSDQEKFSFAEGNGMLIVRQKLNSHTALVGYKSKKLKIVVPSQIKITHLYAIVDGAADCKIEGDFQEIRLDVDGALMASINGSAENFFVDCDGAVEIEDKNFVTNVAELNVDGAMEFEFTCNTS